MACATCSNSVCQCRVVGVGAASVTGVGSVALPYVVNVPLSASPTNALELLADGLYVPDPGTGTPATGGVDVGDIKASIRSTPPSGWLAFGQSIAGAQTTYAALWAVVPTAWKSGTTLILPDMKQRFLVGLDTTNAAFDTLGESGGSNTTTLSTANMPVHTHQMIHGHVGTASNSGLHTHPESGNVVKKFGVGDARIPASASGYGPYNEEATQAGGDHTHTISVSTFFGTTDPAGSGSAFSSIPRYVTVNFFIRYQA